MSTQPSEPPADMQLSTDTQGELEPARSPAQAARAVVKAYTPDYAVKAMEIVRNETGRMRRLIPDGTLEHKQAYRQLERALFNEPKLAIAATKDHRSFLAAVEEWMMSGLPLHRDYCSLVPYGSETVCVRGYRGLETLGYRSGRVSHFKAEAICSNDVIDYNDGTDPYLNFKMALGDRGEVIGAWASAVLTNGHTVFRVIPLARIERAQGASHSKAWKTDETEMTAKTAILALSKFLPMCPDLMVASSVEEARVAGARVKYQPIDVRDQQPDDDDGMVE
jgi:phage RecT family recombinase